MVHLKNASLTLNNNLWNTIKTIVPYQHELSFKKITTDYLKPQI